MDASTTDETGIQYIAYDKRTGAILSTYSKLDAESDREVAVPLEALRKELAEEPFVVERLTDRNPDNLELLETSGTAGTRQGTGLWAVDLKTRRLVLRPVLQLKAEKPRINGDGSDRTRLEIQAVDADGKPVRTVEAQIRVTTSRGKLSAPGGVVTLKEGRAQIELTSTNETVRRVKVAATALDGTCSAGRLTLEFL